MPAPSTVCEFLELVQKSGVVDEKKLDAYAEKLRSTSALPAKPTEMAGVMIRDGLLTNFQAEQFLLGKWRRFTIGKYKVLEKLGTGGMGAVYLCEHKLMRRRVAVKVLPTAKAEDDASLQRFYREARAVAALDHPNIVRAYDIDQDEKLHFLVMEYVDGSSLQDMVKKTGPMDVTRASHYIRQSALGLQHAHDAAKLVHRDIKPGNILVDRTGLVKVLDMGLARFFNDDEDNITKKFDENVLGTADYLAPEQALNSHDVDIRADIYSLGATFYFCLTGRTPFSEGTIAQKLIWHQTRQPKPIRTVRPDVPEGLVAIIDKMMMKEPGQRYQTPDAVAAALEPWTQTPIGPPPEAEMPRLSPAALGPASLVDAPGANRGLASLPPSPPPQRTWQVTPPPARPCNPPAVPRSVAPASPSTALTQPTRKNASSATPLPGGGAPPTVKATKAPAGTRPTATPPNGTVATAPGPKPAPRAETVTDPSDNDEGVSWEKMAAVSDASARTDTDPSSDKKKGSARKTRGQQTEARGNKLLWIIGGAVVGVLLVTGIGVWLAYFLTSFGGSPSSSGQQPPAGLEEVRLSWRPDVPADARTWMAAFQKVRPGGRILIQDEDVTSPLVLGKNANYISPVPNVTIAPAPGRPVRWHPATGTGPPDRLVKLYNVEGLTIRDLKLDGDGKPDDLISVQHSCPGVTFDNLTLVNFKRCAIAFTDCRGEEGRLVTCRGLKIGPASPGGQQPPFGILIDCPGKTPNVLGGQNLEFHDCTFEVNPPFQVVAKQPLDKVILVNNRLKETDKPDLPVTALPAPTPPPPK